jgi:hypothetical protein
LFASTPLDLWCREGLEAEMCNRFTLGRTRDDAYTYGGDRLFQELALAVCAQEGRELRCNHLDPTRVSLSGEYVPASDAHAMTMPHGYSKDHRPDLKPAVLARMVSQDGGRPLVSKSGEGHTSDIPMVQERAQALMHAFKNTPNPRSLVADAPLSHEDHASSLTRIGCITRIPNTLGVVSQVIRQALGWDPWPPCDDHTRDQPLEWCHEGMAQRWLVVSSQAALERATATVTKAKQREHPAIIKPRLPWHAQRGCAPHAAPDALAALAQRWTYHRAESSHLSAHQHDAGHGRPTPRTPLKAIEWPIQAHVGADDATSAHHQHVKACVVLGSTIAASEWSHAEVMAADKGQSQVEGGVRWFRRKFCVEVLQARSVW